MPQRFISCGGAIQHWIGRTLFFLRLIAACLIVLGASAAGQISPGPLSRAHRSLDGTTNCASCHRIGGQRTFKCLDCHSEIAARISAGAGLHARVVKNDSASQECASCHSEHNGELFALIKWEPSQAQFDHSRSGWPLMGKHAALACNQCHQPSKMVSSQKSLIKVKDLSRSYLGLSRDCVTCHSDTHQGQLGKGCEQCHITSDWKKVPSFDHSRTRFALTGGHARVACEKCHTPVEKGGAARWTGLVFDRCTGCHTDPHRGSFAATCQSCHNTANWKAVPTNLLAAKFDHSATKYPLLGKHVLLRCEQCHAGGDFKRPIAFQKCTDCHRPDPHGGQFLKRADAGECSSCHTVAGFKPSKFGLSEHKTTAYPLEAAHASVACEKCHVPAGKGTVYKLKFTLCTNCHKDTHDNQFAAAPLLNRCESCHTVSGFRPSTFTLARHKDTRFTLAGSHIAVACGECHRPMSGTGKVARYRFQDRSCTACHQDPHRGQFRDRMISTAPTAKGCEACHSVNSWKDVSGFDHASTHFPLLGAHRAVACSECHLPPNMETTLANVSFRSAPTSCDGCHKDPHAGQFALAGVAPKCESCHNSNRWKPSLFDHTRTRFPLEGVHKNVRCARCHTLMKGVNGNEVLFYKPTPVDCVSCHGPNVTAATNGRS